MHPNENTASALTPAGKKVMMMPKSFFRKIRNIFHFLKKKEYKIKKKNDC